MGKMIARRAPVIGTAVFTVAAVAVAVLLALVGKALFVAAGSPDDCFGM